MSEPTTSGDGLPEPTSSAETATSNSAAPAESLDQLETDLLAQTAEVVAQVQEQMTNLARREASFRTQQSQLDQDQRAFRLQQQQWHTHCGDWQDCDEQQE